jgi:signal transduction histidine kinase
MELHGGEIEIESVPGQGTIARLIFPPLPKDFEEKA